MSSILEEQVGNYLITKGWKLCTPSKVRGMRPDIIAEKNGKLAMVDVRGPRGDLNNGIKKVLHFQNAANYSYLAVPRESITDKLIDLCKGLGIGLVAIDKKSKEIIKPEQTTAMTSVKNKIFNQLPEKPKIRKKGLLGTLFRSQTFVSILNILFLNPTREYYLGQLAHEANVSVPTALRELQKMQPLDIINKTKKGNIFFYGINKDCIIYSELKRIFLKFELIDKIISEELGKFDIKYALIYGSFARNTETETSDLDLMIIGDVNRMSLLRIILKLEAKIGREINFILWSDAEFADKIKEKIPLLTSVVENDIVMIRGDEDEFKRTIDN